MHAQASKTKMPFDGKTKIGYAFWNLVNRIVVAHQFEKVDVVGRENIPQDGPFLLIANHSSRWDGPLVQHVLNRRANYMVSPNEMIGLQGAAVMSVGAFPAHPRLNPVGYALDQLGRGEPVVVFPEGNVFYDGVIHPFKLGVARIALGAWEAGQSLPIVPVYIDYRNLNDCNSFPSVRVTIGEAITRDDFAGSNNESTRELQTTLAQRLFEMVSRLKAGNKKPTMQLVDTTREALSNIA